MVLALLSSADNFFLSPTELSEKLDISRTNITRVFDSLEKFGFIRVWKVRKIDVVRIFT
ncbi:TPA: MarR family transcriptional regulator [Escherichia coli]